MTCGTTLFDSTVRSNPLCRVPSHPSPDNAGAASLLLSAFHCAVHIALRGPLFCDCICLAFTAPGSLRDRATVLLPRHRFKKIIQPKKAFVKTKFFPAEVFVTFGNVTPGNVIPIFDPVRESAPLRGRYRRLPWSAPDRLRPRCCRRSWPYR